MTRAQNSRRRSWAVAVVASAIVGGATLATAAAAPSAGQVEKTFGRTAVGTTFGFPGADYKYGSRYTLPENGTVTKITAHMRGRLAGGATAGATQRFRMMIYASDGPGGNPGTLLATSAERVIADNAPEANYEFTVQPGVALPAGSYWLMQQSGASGSQVGLSEQIVSPGNQRFNADLYGDGPSNPAGAMSADPKEYVIFATYLTSATGGGGNDVVICHKPGTPAQQTLSVPVQALESHLAHGDRRGAC